MNDREQLAQQLNIAQAVLAVLEQQAAGFGSLHIPAHLQVELEQKRNEVASLKARLAQLEGRLPHALPDTLPRRQAFFGRQDEIERCLVALAPDHRAWGAIIDGIGGMGKTALALEVAHITRERAWFDAYLFASAKTSWLTPEGVRAETLTLSSLDAFVREFARGLGESSLAKMPDAIARRKSLLDALRGKRALLIWDNLETLTAEERSAIAEFLQRLPAPNKAIITSRYRTGESAVTVRLDRLDEQAAGQLMDDVGTRSPRVATELRRVGAAGRKRLYETAGGNPLAMHWTLGLVAQKGYSFETALARLTNAAQSGDLYRFLFAEAARGLEESDKKLLAVLSTFQTPAPAQALADASGLAPTVVGVALERLVLLSLVNDLSDGRYGLHILTRGFVRVALASSTPTAAPVRLDPAAQRTALRYWLDFAQKYGAEGKDAYITFDRLEAEWPNLEAAAASLWASSGLPGPMQDKEAAGMIIDLDEALRQFLWFRGYWNEDVRLGAWRYEAGRALERWQDAGWGAYDVAWIHSERNETAPAETWTGRMAAAMEKGGARSDRAEAVRMRGLLADQRGDLAEAERLLGEALAEFRALDGEGEEGIVLSDLGDIASKQKAYDRAEGYYRHALAIDEKRGDVEGQASDSGHMGELALERGRLDEARWWLEKALKLAHEVRREALIAICQSRLAQVLEKEGRYAEALPLAEDALRIQERLGYGDMEATRDLVQRLRVKAQAT